MMELLNMERYPAPYLAIKRTPGLLSTWTHYYKTPVGNFVYGCYDNHGQIAYVGRGSNNRLEQSMMAHGLLYGVYIAVNLTEDEAKFIEAAFITHFRPRQFCGILLNERTESYPGLMEAMAMRASNPVVDQMVRNEIIDRFRVLPGVFK